MSGKKDYEDICYTEKIKTEKVKFVWKITDFSKRKEKVTSASFPTSAPKNIGKWILELNPPIEYRETRDTSVALKQETSLENSAQVIFTLMNHNGVVLKTEVKRHKKGAKEGAYAMLTHVDLWQLASRLPNDELTIICEMEITLPPVNRLRANFEPPPCRLGEDLGMLLDSESLSDVTIAVAGAELKAHKAILAARSPVFAAMFSNQMLEKETSVVEITDMDKDVVQAMLEFIYTGKEISQTRWAHDLLAAASKYQLDRLMFMCEEALNKVLTLDNVLEIFALADLHGAARLKKHCISFVIEHRVAVLRSPSWDNFKCSRQSLAAEIREMIFLQEQNMDF